MCPRYRLSAALAAAVLLVAVTACTASTSTSRPRAEGATATTAPPAAKGSSAPAAKAKALPGRFEGTSAALPAGLAAEMRGTTWQPGCPVPLRDLRLLALRYWGFDGKVHEGPMVVNRAVAGQVTGVFRRLFRARFPIQELHLAVQYVPGEDDPNDTRDYTASFNCRPVVTARGARPTWSQHAYGLAIDINPIQNPFVGADGYVHNNHARRYRDRSLRRTGMIHAGDAVVRSFAAAGWKWGGAWRSEKDYMHFSVSGR
ncbi:MAG TPA: M15 family metallopeptidase [Actinomycetes bacterium]|nr:M15 family metallopeptidase [Actinomycetes bacterium]